MSSLLIHTNRANEDVERQLKSGGPETFDSAPSFLDNSTHGKLSTTLYAYIEDIYCNFARKIGICEKSISLCKACIYLRVTETIVTQLRIYVAVFSL